MPRSAWLPTVQTSSYVPGSTVTVPAFVSPPWKVGVPPTSSSPRTTRRLCASAPSFFSETCSACHTLDAAASRGSKPEGQVSGGERTNGPNFNTRKVQRDDVLFAIRNGGFSGAIMPANIVVGEEAEAVADFLEKYSGRKSAEPPAAQTESSGGE